jgi:hypothetical protein
MLEANKRMNWTHKSLKNGPLCPIYNTDDDDKQLLGPMSI